MDHSKSALQTTSPFCVTHCVDDSSQEIEVTSPQALMQNVAIKLVPAVQVGMAVLHVTLNDEIFVEGLVSLEGVEKASVEIDDSFCELDFGAFSIVVSLDDSSDNELSVALFDDEGDEFEPQTEGAAFISQLVGMLS